MAVMRPLPETGTSSGTPEKTASLMSMTNRGGSFIGKVVKLGFCVPMISTVPPFTETFLMVLTWGSAARAIAPARSTRASTPSAPFLTAAMLSPRPRAVQRTPGRTHTYSRWRRPSPLEPGQRRATRPVRPRVLHEILHVVADLPDVVSHRQLDVAVPLHRSPEEVLAPGRAVHAPGRLHRGERIHVPEDDGHRDGDVLEALLVVVAGPVTGQLPAADPPG